MLTYCPSLILINTDGYGVIFERITAISASKKKGAMLNKMCLDFYAFFLKKTLANCFTGQALLKDYKIKCIFDRAVCLYARTL